MSARLDQTAVKRKTTRINISSEKARPEIQLTPSIRSPWVNVTVETSLVKGRFLRCRALLVARTFDVSLHKLPAKPSFDTQVTMADIVVEGRGSFDNLIVLDVER
jgi:hypothetical protein